MARRSDGRRWMPAAVVGVAALVAGLVATAAPAAPPAAAAAADRLALQGVDQMGGPGTDLVRGVDIGPDGSITSAVEYAGPVLLGTGVGSVNEQSPGRYHPDAAVVRQRADGTVAWAVSLSAASSLKLYDVAVDAGGTAYGVGAATGALTISGRNGPTTVTGADSAGFVAAFDPLGDVLWVRLIDGPGAEVLMGAGAGGGPGVVVTGMYGGTVTVGSGPTATTLTTGAGVSRELVVARFTATGDVAWATSGDGSLVDLGRDVVVDSAGSAYVSGLTVGAMQLGPGPRLSMTAAGPGGFVAAFDAAGAPRWLTALGGNLGSFTVPWAVALDGAGTRLAVAGAYQGSPAFPVAGGGRAALPNAGGVDGFTATFDPADGSPGWTRTVGSTGTDALPAVTFAPDGGVLAGGWIGGATSFGGIGLATSGPTDLDDGVLVSWDAAGTPQWARTLAGSGDAQVLGAASAGSEVVLTGQVGPSTTVGSQLGSQAVTSRGGLDGFVARTRLQADRPPALHDTTARTAVGQPVTLDLGVSDPDGDPVTLTAAAGGPALGTLGGTPAAPVYTPSPGVTGTDTFTVVADDGLGGTATAQVTVDVSADDRPPVAGDLTLTTTAGVDLAVTLPATDPDLDPLTYAVDPPALGTWSGTAPALTYSTPADAVGTEVLHYTVDDGRGGTATGTLTLTVLAPSADHPPVPGAVRHSTAPGTPATVTLATTDPDGDPLTYAVDAPGPAHGTLTGTPPTITYTPAAGFRGVDTFTFTADDGRGGRTQGTVTMAVRPPNVVIVVSDDQTLEQQRFMPKTNALLGGEGTTFSDFTVSYAECCPARATLLTGQYSHNDNVLSSALPTGGVSKLDSSQTLATWFQGAGYRTSLAGKYLNGYGMDIPASVVPPGWSDWYALQDPSTYNYFDYAISANGVNEWHGSADDDYVTDVLARHAEAQVRATAGGDQPLFLMLTPPGPHTSNTQLLPIPAPRHAGTFAGQAAPRHASFDEVDVSDKPAPIRALPRLDDHAVHFIDTEYAAAVETLQSVDDAVEGLYTTLAETGELDNTVFVFTSDNGFQYGEHRIPYGKTRPYEESIRVPLLVRGPGFPAGAVVDRPTVNPDLAATVLDEAGISPTLPGDGVSLRAYPADPSYGVNRGTLIEDGPYPFRVQYRGIRTSRWIYVRWSTGDKELYDRLADPDQTASLAADPRYGLLQLALGTTLTQLEGCAGTSCRVGVP